MRINQKIVSNTKNKSELLIVDICLDNRLIAVSDLLTDSPKRPFFISLEHVESDINSARVSIADHDFPEIFYQPDSAFDPRWIDKRDQCLATIKPLIVDPDLKHRYLYGESNGILKQLIIQSGRSKKYVSSCLNRYFKCGGMKNSLLPRYYECGLNHQLPTKTIKLDDGKICLASKRGRETNYGNPYRGITQQDIKNIDLFSKSIRSGEEVVLSKLYLDYCMTYASVELSPKSVGDGEVSESVKVLLPKDHLISPRSFKRQLMKCIDKLTFIKKRVGSINYARDHAAKPGVAKKGLRGPTYRYEIDSTIADIYIRDEYSQDELVSIGRPTIYLVVDTYSTMIVGIHVGFGNPCWHGASQALFNAMSNKIDFCREYGVDIKESEWPCQEVCRELTMDRGSENSDNNITAILQGQIGIKAANLNALHRGDMKGTVEKSFHLLQEMAIPPHAGKVMKVPKKEDQHPSRKPLYSYSDFMNRLINTILFLNNNRASINSQNFEMSRDGVGFTPRDVWNWGLKQAVIGSRVSADKLRFALLPEAEATVMSQGIYFRGLYYSCNEIVRRNYLDKARNLGRFKIKIRYSDVTTNYIWLKDAVLGDVIQLDINDRSEAYKNHNWENVMRQQEITKERLANMKEREFSERVARVQKFDKQDKQIQASIRRHIKSNAKSIQGGMKDRKMIDAAMQRHREGQSIVAELVPVAQLDTNPRPLSAIGQQDLTDPTIFTVQEK